jgi:hypothetical protein
MRVTKSLFFILAALVGILALAAPVNAQVCEDPDKVKFKDGAACVKDLTVKWNEMVTTLIIVDNHLNVGVSNIEAACDELGVEDSDFCEGSFVTDPDFNNAYQYTADAVEDLDLALLSLGNAADTVADFQAELAGLMDKLDGAGTDYGFGDRNRNSASRTAQLINALADKALAAFGDATAGTGIAGWLAAAMTDLQDAADELASGDSDEDTALGLLNSAHAAAFSAFTSKDRTLRKTFSQLRYNLNKLAKFFKVAIANPRRASEGFSALSSDQIQVYTMSGQLVSVSPAAALDRISLANGVYVAVHSNGRVEKLVVLH